MTKTSVDIFRIGREQVLMYTVLVDHSHGVERGNLPPAQDHHPSHWKLRFKISFMCVVPSTGHHTSCCNHGKPQSRSGGDEHRDIISAVSLFLTDTAPTTTWIPQKNCKPGIIMRAGELQQQKREKKENQDSNK